VHPQCTDIHARVSYCCKRSDVVHPFRWAAKTSLAATAFYCRKKFTNRIPRLLGLRQIGARPLAGVETRTKILVNRTTLPPRQLDPPPHALTACELVFSAVVSSDAYFTSSGLMLSRIIRRRNLAYPSGIGEPLAYP
jgi:hypothetical protein